MPSNPKIVEQMKDRQKRVFRIAQDPARYGLTLKAISIDSGLGYDSVRNYAACAPRPRTPSAPSSSHLPTTGSRSRGAASAG